MHFQVCPIKLFMYFEHKSMLFIVIMLKYEFFFFNLSYVLLNAYIKQEV
jgi:hypothetical protein